MTLIIVIIYLFYSIQKLNGQTVTIWSDTLDSYPSDWDTTNTALESSSSNCPSSTICWNIKGGGGDISRIFSSIGYNKMNVTFGINVNIGNNDFCEIYYKPGSIWILEKQFDSSTTKMSSKSLSIPSSANNKNGIGIRFVNTGNRQNQDSCYIDNVQVIGILIPTPLPTSNPTPSPPTTSTTINTSTNNNGTIDVNEYEQDSGYDPSTKTIVLTFMYIGCSCLIAILCICPLLLLTMHIIKEIIIDIYGIQTVGTVTSKKVTGGGKGASRGTRSYDVWYKYITKSNSESELEEDWRTSIAEVSSTWYETINVGDQLDIKYLSSKPDWVKLKGTGCHYIHPLICIIIVSAAVVGTLFLMRYQFGASVGVAIAIFFGSLLISVLCCSGFIKCCY